ncbi:MAG TPA: phosphatidylserine/phosphatidylglycerophosphate/cardiolipin synthase family protein [Gaiellaceae bacterium]|nr:phosphatidylserine/phosphatidylglycerophosphate/cardiolipin synthase family protein [Gaiellaceae bacterium]
MLEIETLTDGGQQALDVAQRVADFVAGAEQSLDVAQYDFHLAPDTAAVVGGAIRRAAGRGVAVRFLYNVDHRNPIPVPPPPEPDAVLIESLGVPARAIAGVPDLMHHKFAVRDGNTVWTGSTNWTDESWSRQENVVTVVESEQVATRFARNFDELWETGDVERTGFVEPDPVDVGGLAVRSWFTPGFGEELSSRIGVAIGRAKRRVRIASPVITAAPILSSLAQVISEGTVDVAGVVDQPQVQGVIVQWRQNGNIAWKLPLLERVMAAPFAGKRSTPWGVGTLHDFMHAKVTVADDTVFVGSFNLSRSGEMNAENVLEIADPALAERLAAWIDGLRARYPDGI